MPRKYKPSKELQRTIRARYYARNPERVRALARINTKASILRKSPEARLVHYARSGKSQRKLECTITEADINVPDVCPVLGIPLFFSEKRTWNTPTLDRKDNSKGYIPGNVFVISWRANRLKADMSFSELEALYKYMTS